MDISVLTDYNATLAETLTNKTLTAPIFIDGGFIADANENEMLVFQTTDNAENALEITNSVAGAAIIIGAFGSDDNIDIDIKPKGSGGVTVGVNGTGHDVTFYGASQATVNFLSMMRVEGKILLLQVMVIWKSMLVQL